MSKGFLSSFAQAHMRGMDMAAREHSSLKLDLSQRVDIFAILQQRGVWVMFQPLDALYGVCLQQDKTDVGILINVKHPPSLQRFTASHEYGHVVFQHGISYDDEKSIFPSHRGSTIQEVEAQTFAAHFLMPIQLVNRVLKHMGLPLKPGKLSKFEVYQLSLRLGTSYLSVVNHLVALKKLDPQVAQMLRRVQPKDIKSSIKRGLKPTNSWADVWTIDEHDCGQQIILALDDEVHLYLPENEYTQDIRIMPECDGALPLKLMSVNIEMMSRQSTQMEEQLTYVQHFVLHAAIAGDTQVIVENAGSEKSISTFDLWVKTLARHAPGVLESQQRYL